jgi:hypothetical protein
VAALIQRGRALEAAGHGASELVLSLYVAGMRLVSSFLHAVLTSARTCLTGGYILGDIAKYASVCHTLFSNPEQRMALEVRFNSIVPVAVSSPMRLPSPFLTLRVLFRSKRTIRPWRPWALLSTTLR